MKRTVCRVPLTLAAGIVLGVLGGRLFGIQQVSAQPASSQSGPVKRTILQRKDIEGVDGKEAILILAEIVPGGVLGRHYHPGPEIGYVTEGTMRLEQDGHPPLTVRAGESFHHPSKIVHDVKNPDQRTPVKVVDCLIADKGQPLTTPVR
jgi:quercetin dioxygenase-like cupin family protein